MSDHVRAMRCPSARVAVFVTLLMAIVAGPGSAAPASAGARADHRAPAHPSGNPWLYRRFLNMAHAGGENEAPADMYAFKRAVAVGADMVETSSRPRTIGWW